MALNFFSFEMPPPFGVGFFSRRAFTLRLSAERQSEDLLFLFFCFRLVWLVG